MSRWRTTDLRFTLTACGAITLPAAAIVAHAHGSSAGAEAGATIVAPGRLSVVLGSLPGAVVSVDGARIVVAPAAAPAPAALPAGTATAPPSAPTATAAAAAQVADGTLRGDIVVAVSAPAAAPAANGEAPQLTVAFN